VPLQCPPGFFCIGSSDVYQKCGFGYFCPKQSAYPTPCPNGSYGSGSAENFDEASGCRPCGRGLYSEDDPTQCTPCTPGFVCVGQTSSSRPSSNETDNGYECPTGSYCPLASYREKPCPIGTYSKNKKSTSELKCLPCKVDWYNDLPGQGGCKKCGPTSHADGGALTCQCVGANRDFVKGNGACLCTIGYQPKNNAPNKDSGEDCEQIVTAPCTEDQEVSVNGDCLDETQQGEECER